MTFTLCSIVALAAICCFLDSGETNSKETKGDGYIRDHNNLFGGKTYEIKKIKKIKKINNNTTIVRDHNNLFNGKTYKINK